MSSNQQIKEWKKWKNENKKIRNKTIRNKTIRNKTIRNKMILNEVEIRYNCNDLISINFWNYHVTWYQ